MTQVGLAEPVDYLTRLPTELLHYICDLVILPVRERYRVGFISKAFLPYARNRTFRVVSCWRPVQLEQLRDLVEANAGVRPYIKELSIWSQAKEADSISPKDFVKTLGRLEALEDLTLGHATSYIKTFLSDTRTRRLLPSLIRLTLRDSFAGWQNPFDCAHYARLSRHPELRYLELDVQRTPESLGRYTAAETVSVLQSKWQCCLSLRGPIFNLAVDNLVLSFYSIHTLFLHDTSPSANPSLVFDAVHYPDTVRTLSLNFHSRPPSSTISSIVRALAPFASLRCLIFERHSYDSSFLPTLRNLPKLECLEFEEQCGVTAADIRTLLEGAQSLRRLELGQLKWEWQEDEDGDEVCLPLWETTFTVKDFERILAMCEARDIALRGSLGEFVKRERIKKQEEARKKAAAKEQA